MSQNYKSLQICTKVNSPLQRMFRKVLFPTFKRSPTLLKSLFLSTAVFTGYNLYEKQRSKASACGIIAYLGHDPIALDVIINGIKLLQNRGYDSTGIATLSPTDNALHVTKLASDPSKKVDCIDKIEEVAPPYHIGARIGIGHTRWATCGEKTDVNAHPHTDSKNRIAVVHNGTLENVEELREELKHLGVNLVSKTDTEVIPQFIGYYMDHGMSFHDAVTKTLKEKVVGTWGIVILNKENPENLVVGRNGSPILIGLAQNAIYVASESIAFEKYTNNHIKLEDHEIVYIDLKNTHEFYKNVKERIQTVNIINPQIKPKAPFTTFFEQEILEQPEAIIKCLNFGARLSGEPGSAKLGGFDANKSTLIGINHLLIVACGTSFYAGLFGAKIYKMLGCFQTVQVFIASEFSESDLPDEGAGVLLISQSGETADVYKVLTMAKNRGIPTIGIVNVVGSLIASNVDCGIYLNSGREVSVPATKSFTSQIIALVLTALWFSHNKGIKSKYKIRSDIATLLHSLPITVGKTLYDIDAKCKELASVIEKEQNIFVLGKGFGESIARESALKLKEVAYIHAEAFASGELKHGPLALLESEKVDHTKIILFIFNDEYLNDMLLTLSEVKANKAYTIVITDCPQRLPHGKANYVVEIPSLGCLTGLLAVLPIQKLSFYVAVKKEINMDKPRNLAKTVTVQ